MICIKCGAQIDDDSLFCPNCGNRVSPSSDPERVEHSDPLLDCPDYNSTDSQKPASKPVDPKTTSIVCYFTWIGLLVMILVGDREHAKVHLNNSLLIVIARFVFFALGKTGFSIFEWISVLGLIASVVFWFIGVINACIGKNDELPFIGQIHLIQYIIK